MGEQTLAERVNDEVTVRAEPCAVRWELADLVAQDGHVVRVGFAARVRALGAAAEVQMLRETLLGEGERVTAGQVRRYFQSAIRGAAMQAVAVADASALLAADQRPRLEAALVKAAQGIAFTCGIEVLPPFELNIDSPTLALQRLEALQRQQAEARQQHRRAVEEAMASGRPVVSEGLSAEEFVEHLSAAMDLAAQQAPRAMLAAVSGKALVMVDIANGAVAPMKLVSLVDDLGPLRSVRPTADGRLLAGAQRGVLLVARHAVGDVVRLCDAEGPTSELGFNDAVQWAGGVWACHAAGGLVAWDEHEPDAPARTWRTAELQAQLDVPDGTPRHLTPLDDRRLVFAMGGVVCTVDEEGEVRGHAEGGAGIVHLSVHGGRLHVVRGDGSGEVREAASLAVVQRWRGGAAASAAGSMVCLGQWVALTAGEDGTVTARGVQGGVARSVRQFISTSRGPRKVIATPRYVAALAPDRQRVVLWLTIASEPLVTLHLTPQTRHRVADICWVEA